jgi:glutamate/tyrosine decarboxylase-like PLP-dependent enzyme
MTDAASGGAARLAPHGLAADELLAELDERRSADLDWRGGRAFSLVYHADDEDLDAVLHAVASRYLHENALNPMKYPSLVHLEREVVAIAAGLFGTDPRAGTMASGGTESIFLAVHTARSQADERGVTTPNIVTAETVHPAFAKACHYLRVEHRRTPVGSDGRADPDAFAATIDAGTILLVGSAPCYPFGVIDPIPALAQVALERGLPFHVDACLGGWLLPFWARIGEPVPPWDLRVDGVTSLSADLHKYGYAFKGASVILYRDREAVRHQWFLFDGWPGGLYGSPTTAGTRPAAPIAGAWAALRHLGEEGYLRKAEQVRDGTRAFTAAVDGQEGLAITHRPDLSVFEIGSTDPDEVDIEGVGDALDGRGWNLDRQQGGLHVMISPYHRHVADAFARDLADAVAERRRGTGTTATYGASPDP